MGAAAAATFASPFVTVGSTVGFAAGLATGLAVGGVGASGAGVSAAAGVRSESGV